MELRLGYKQTEVGVIPEDWEVQPLEALGEALIGLTYKPADVRKHGTLVLRSSNIQNDSLAFDDNVFVDTEIPQHIMVRPGDVLVCVRNGSRDLIGKSALLDDRTVGMTFGAFMAVYRSPLGELAAYLFQSPILKRQINEHLGATINQITNRSLNSFRVPVPPSEVEQRAIAAALSDVDALLEGLTRLIAKKRDLKQAAMQQLLTGQTRLPGFKGEWEVKRLGELAEMGSGGTPTSSVLGYYDGDIPWVSISDMTKGGKIIVWTDRNLTRAGFSNSAAQMFSVGTVLYAMYASLGECSIAGISLCSSQAILGIRPHHGLSNEFLYYYLTSLKRIVKSLGQQGTQANLNKGMVQDFQLRLPAVPEQNAIAAVLSDMDAELSALAARRDKTRALKQAMMQELLTGKTRLLKPGTAGTEKPAALGEERRANLHFVRSVLAAEIVDLLHEEPTFGHVKLHKLLFLVDRLCDVETGSTYHRKAAGPYDNQAMRSIDSQLRKQQWFDARKEGGRYWYAPMDKRGGHRRYFEQYFAAETPAIHGLLDTFRTFDTERCEIVATLFAAWDDLLRAEGSVSDDRIVHEVLTNWHESKQRIPQDRWRSALGWMRAKGFVPRREIAP